MLAQSERLSAKAGIHETDLTMKLAGIQVQAISEAILDAYRAIDALRVMVRIELNEILEEIVDGEGLRILVFNLITWAEKTDRVGDLIEGAASA